MKRLLLAAIILSVAFFFSCGRRNKPLKEGTTVIGGVAAHWEIFTKNDSCYKTITFPGLGSSVLGAASEKALDDSTFKERVYSAKGKLLQTKAFLLGIPDGEWITYNEHGKKISYSFIRNGALVKYLSWFDDGTLQTEGESHPDGSMMRKEYYPNGNLFQEFFGDTINGDSCKTYYLNKQLKGEGEALWFHPSGPWKRFDSLGKPLPDTIYRVILR